MENRYHYFKRDISWLSFNYRVLLEAEDTSLPIYERIKFLSIYSSNLEEFYEIRVAEHRAVVMKKRFSDESCAEAEAVLSAITDEVNRQQRAYYRIFSEQILPELNRQNIYLYQSETVEPFHQEFVCRYFNEEVFPFLSPVMIQRDEIRTFIRDRRLYLIVRMTKRGKRSDGVFHYALMKIPFSKVPRFIELPDHEGRHYLMFIDDMIRANLQSVFPGYEIESCYSIKISRDADIYLDHEEKGSLVADIKEKVKKRKIGALSRFMYDQAMPEDFLRDICAAFGVADEDLVRGGRYHNLQDLSKLPNPVGKSLEQQPLAPMRVPFLDGMGSMFKAVKRRDVLLHFPYESFDYLIRNSDFYGMDYKRSKWVALAAMENTLRLSRKPDLVFEFGGHYQSEALQCTYDIGPSWRVDAGLKWTFAGGKADLSIKGNDLFDSLTPVSSVDFGDQQLHMGNEFHTRNVTVNLVYRFGGYKEKKRKEVDTSRFGH